MFDPHPRAWIDSNGTVRECDEKKIGAAFHSRNMQPCVYILASRRNGTLYVGMTTNLARRITQHQQGALPGFTRRYGVKRLVWAEPQRTIHDALARERRIKRWRRAWKLVLIERDNPEWRDLYDEFFGSAGSDM